MQNESETEIHRVYKVSPIQQPTKLTHLWRQSGDFLHGDKEVAYIVTVFIVFVKCDMFRSVKCFVCHKLSVIQQSSQNVFSKGVWWLSSQATATPHCILKIYHVSLLFCGDVSWEGSPLTWPRTHISSSCHSNHCNLHWWRPCQDALTFIP